MAPVTRWCTCDPGNYNITLTVRVTSLPAQRQAPLTTSYNLVDSYTRVLLYVVHTNLMLQPSVLMLQPRLGVTEMQLWLR